MGIFFRSFNLNWGAPFYFHPDERNIVSAVTQLNFPSQLNPHFFAYGSFPIYVIYFTGLLYHVLLSLLFSSPVTTLISFTEGIFISRFYSSLFSVLSIFLIFITTKRLANTHAAFLASAFFSVSVGAVQFAHFGTFEMWLTFFSLVLFYYSLALKESFSIKNIIFTGITFGLLVAIKISSLPLLLIPFTALLLPTLSLLRKSHNQYTCILVFIRSMLALIALSACIFIVSSPFVFLDSSSFKGSMEYESGVALGTLPVFYTGDFYRTIPVVYQFINIYPFIINSFMTVVFLLCLSYFAYFTFKTKNTSYMLLLGIFSVLFLSQAFLFAKWIRYIIPTLPYIFIITAIVLLKRKNVFTYLCCVILLICSCIYSFSYLTTVLNQEYTTIRAAIWAQKHIPAQSRIITETYDLGILPFNNYFSNITLFNFYDLDNVPEKENELRSMLASTGYIILPSQRILRSRITKPDKFPKGHAFYSALLSEKLGFKKIYETPCSLFCKIIYLNNPVFSFEQTATVFDRPTVFIFEKIRK